MLSMEKKLCPDTLRSLSVKHVLFKIVFYLRQSNCLKNVMTYDRKKEIYN